jgi:hypothetical protein
MKRCSSLLAASVTAGSVLLGAAPRPALAEQLVETDMEARTILAYRAPEAAVEHLLPAGWRADPAAGGASKGANLLVVLIDRLLAQDAEGKPEDSAPNRLGVLVVPARQAETGMAGLVVVGGYSSNPHEVPGPYGLFEHAQVKMHRDIQADADGSASTEETWDIAADGGDHMAVHLRYPRDAPTHGAAETRVFSGLRPDFHRIYRADQGVSVLRSSATGADRLQAVDVHMTGPHLAALFDGSERLVGAASLPWYSRQVFLP